MPTFLLITGYLVNVEKSKKAFATYLTRLFLPYVIMVIGFSVLSFYLPVQDRLTEMSAKAILTKMFVTSIGPYWFLQTMIICGTIYYTCFRFLRGRLEIISILLIFYFFLIIIAEHSQSLSVKAIPYYFLGASLRQAHVRFSSFFKASPYAILPIIALLFHGEMKDWGTIATLTVVYCLISFLDWLDGVVHTWWLYKHILFIGANTLPIYLFHPIFTLLAKFYLPLFAFDATGIVHAFATIVIATTGSILIARMMEKSRLAYLFGKQTMLRKY